MNLITRMELTDLTDAELSALFGLIVKEISQAKTGSVEWHGAVISLENIRREQAKRRVVIRPRPRGPGF
jgi:hypothetical protein